jgi:TonB family protein
VAGVLALQVLLVLAFSSRQPLPRRAPLREFQLTLAPAAASGSAFAELQALADPTLFALPSSRGFAGAGRTRGIEQAYQPREWTEPLHWLTNSAAFTAPATIAAAPAGSGAVGLEKPGPRVSDAIPTPLPLPEKSLVRFEGPAARRGLRSVPDVPVIVHSNLLADTAVRVGVQGDGLVFSAAIARSSGLRSADEQALAIARNAHFEPVPAAGGSDGASTLSWGELVFRWRVVKGTERPRS